MRKTLNEILTLLESNVAKDRALGLTYVGKQRCYGVLDRCINCLQTDSDDDVRAMAAWALDRLGSPATVPVLLNAMYDKMFGVRSNAGWALVHLSERTLPQMVVPDVIEVLAESNNEDARQMAYFVLSHIGGASAEDAIRRYWRR